MSAPPRIGVMALARATFDVPYAESLAAEAFQLLDELPAEFFGSRALLFDRPAAEAAISELEGQSLDRMLILQVTFTDAGTAVALAQSIPAPFIVWAFPEPRTGGRLRLNGLGGLNLAAHALGLSGRDCTYLYAAPGENARPDLERLLIGPFSPPPSPARFASRPLPVGERKGEQVAASEDADKILAKLARARIGVVGAHPDGFHTCAYDPELLRRLTGVEVDRVELPAVFQGAADVSADRVAQIRDRVSSTLADLDSVEQEPLEKSFRVYAALRDLAKKRRLDALAVRCWPEFFTEYGCAACGPMAMLSEDGVPCACEADVHGNLTSLMLQEVAREPAFLVDLVDIDPTENTGVLWHCGLAPLSMADPVDQPRATIHSNRKMPLLQEFSLKPGRITLARLSQARRQLKMVVGAAEMLRAPKSFSGTSGVVRFGRPAGEVLDTIIAEGLEHHLSFAYGDYREALGDVAARLSLPVLELC